MSKIYLMKIAGGSTEAYFVDNLSNLNWTVDSPVTPMPLPEDSHEENILVKMEGNTAKMDLSWTLTEGTQFGNITLSNGVYSFVPGASKTVFEQIKKWKEEFVPISIGDKFKILVTNESNGEELIDEGTIANMTFSVSGSSPVVWNASCAFYVGNVVAVLEADIPPAPTEVKFSSPSSGTIAYTFTPYDGYATEPSGDAVITGHIYKYKKDNGVWTTVNVNNLTDPPANITSLAAGTYRFRLALVNGNSSDAATYYWKNGTITNGTSTSVPVS